MGRLVYLSHQLRPGMTMHFNPRVAILVLSVAFFAGCSNKEPAENFTEVPDNDPQMLAAIEKAKATVATFEVALRAPKPGQTGFSVKAPISDHGYTEHFWLLPVSFDGKEFHGQINNDPEKVKTVKLGQEITIAPSQISDWMYIENHKLVGGFTLRVLHDRMSPAERADFDEHVPFTID